MEAAFKKRSRGVRDVRKRSSTSEEPEVARSAVVTKKQRAAPREAVAAMDRYGQRTVHAAASSSGVATNQNDNRADATRTTEWDLEGEFAKELGTQPQGGHSDNLYRGTSQYATYTEKRDDGSSAKFKTKGPIKAPTNVRTITVVDYQPDVCKDYKETGYCGFGDTCKFLHDRSDYLAGWQLDTVGEAADARSGTFGTGLDDDDEEDIPFACLLCRKPFTDPIVTRCGHYFCAQCAIRRYAKTPKCFACGAKTHGLFNSATKILARMAKRQASRAEERQDLRVRHGLEDELLEGVEVEAAS